MNGEDHSMSSNLPECLSAFVASVNAHPQIGRLLKGWEPLLQIEATDDGQQFHLRIENARVGDVGLGRAEAEHAVLVRGESAVLTRVFSGALNPAQAYLEGNLEVFGSDRDQIKLDAISLVLWGM
jgi:SCP-2 sterol transfer family